MKNVLFRLAILAMVAGLSACGMNPQHCTPEMALRGHLDAGPVGVDGGVGVHSTAGSCIPQGVQVVRQPPGQRALQVMESAAPLTDWATNGGEGIERRHANTSAHEWDGRASYQSHARVSGNSTIIRGQTMLPGGQGGYRQSYEDDQSGYRPYNDGYQQGGGNVRSYRRR